MAWFHPYRNHLKTLAKTMGRIAIDLEKEGEITLGAFNSNAYMPSTPITIPGSYEYACVTAAWQCLITGTGNMESGYIDASASSNPGMEIQNSILSTQSEGCVQFDWLESTRIPRIVTGSGEGVPPVSLLYGIDDDIAKCLVFEYNHVAGAWEGAPVDYFVIPIYGHPLKLQFSTLVPDANAAAYPLGFRIDPVEMILGITILLQQIVTGVDLTCDES